ncbi:lycopene cyclase family protein [Streptomonospora wellingtoniae]|uniref:Lycopene cyclase family protein n=1 Tax=Streptomonospora wellingtoniae TaxID=3075544 RepID=A0ABU2KNZ0_9ACTN|nr:lycopene cyclase family protein [Streptomonospora sp. DSM 45055]MDT0300907.1 lycopene cyclase family protein [Streptomonospora sp. DSM 45055]
MRGFDLLIVGAGAAGLSLARAAAGIVLPGVGTPRIALVEPPAGGPRSPDRTWCFWERGAGPWDAVLAARWDTVSVVSPSGAGHEQAIGPQSYKMLRSRDFDEYVRAGLGPNVHQYAATVTAIDDGADHATVHAEGADGSPVSLTARRVFDSRPPTALPAARTTLLQHFRGWFLHTAHDAFDPATALLMDLRTPQPRNGVSFGYVLPLSSREALVEYTEFTRRVLDDEGYDQALHRYTQDVLGLERFTVAASEQGVIPMTDGRLPTRAGRCVFRLGAAGGATRPSTGYTFSGIQRQVASVVRDLERGRPPTPPIPHKRRHLAMDSVLLRALDSGRLDGAAFFARLFARNDMRDVLDFLDGRAVLGRELLVAATAPVAPMSVTALECVFRPSPPSIL